MNVTARLTHEKLRCDEPSRLHLVLSLSAPHVEWEQERPPVCVIPVIDVSGSMQGEKLHQARQSVMKLVDHLAPGDRCGVVAFATEVAVVSPPVEMTQPNKDALKAAVAGLEATSSTNLAGGMLQGLALANGPRLPEGMLVRVILFTDGCANQGVATKSAQLLPLLEQALGRATLSAFGYGADADQELLRDLSTRGKGNYASVTGPDDAMTAFARELGGLLSTCAQAIELRVHPVGRHRVAGVVSDVDAEPDGLGAVVKVPDLLSDETRHLVLLVEVAPEGGPTAGPVAAFEVEGGYTALAGGQGMVHATFRAEADVHWVARGEEQVRPTPELDAVVVQAELGRAQIEAEELARRGLHQEAGGRYAVLYQSALERGHEAVAAAASELAGTVADAVRFRGSAGYRSSMRKGLGRDAAVSYDERAAGSLGRMGRGGSTAAQQRMAESFGKSRPDAAGDGKPNRAGDAGGGVRRKRSRW